MRRSIGLASAACCVLVACGRSSRSVEPAPVAPDPVTSVKPDAAPKPDDVVDFGESGPLVVAPLVPPLEAGNWDHALTRGWSADGSVLAECSTAPLVTSCTLLSRDGKLESFDDDGLPAALVDAKKHAANEARIKALDLRVTSSARWRYARDVEITWTEIAGSGTALPFTPAILRVGARVHGGPTSWFIEMTEKGLDGTYFTIHPELISLSPDGALLGVIAHAFAGEYRNTFPMRMLDVNALAAHAYNDAGFALHQKSDWAGSADAFHKATAADPSFGLAHYNLACAYARLGDARVRDALKKAIDLGDAADVKKRAAADGDFASVKTQPWFVDLVTK